METDWALYALSLNGNLDRKMCDLDPTLTDVTECDASNHLRNAALVFSIFSTIGLIPHLASLYFRVIGYLTPGKEKDPGSLQRTAALLSCIILFEDVPQIIISAVYIDAMGADMDAIGILRATRDVV